MPCNRGARWIWRAVAHSLEAINNWWSYPAETPTTMDEGLRFAIREGGKTVGAGVVVSITE